MSRLQSKAYFIAFISLMFNTHKEHAWTIITLFIFKHTMLQPHSIIYGDRHLRKQAWGTLRGFHVISQSFMQNSSFYSLQTASSKRFCEITASPNARQVKNADHEFTRQKSHFCFISCAFHLEWWSDRFLLYLGTITSQPYPHLEAYPILEYPSKYRYVPKNERLTSFPNWICSMHARHIEDEVTPTRANQYGKFPSTMPDALPRWCAELGTTDSAKLSAREIAPNLLSALGKNILLAFF